MLSLQSASEILTLNAALLWHFYLQNKILTIFLIFCLMISSSIFLRIFKRKRINKKKNKKKEVIRPITDVVGTQPERVAELNNDLAPFGFAYDPNQDFFYSIMDGWQRKFGYCRLYDEAAAVFSMIIDCEPITFEYKGIKYLIEFWKGQYGMTTGGEVGIYSTASSKINVPGLFNDNFYFSVKDEDRINMSFAFRKNGNLLFTRTDFHWWITGFKLAEFSYPKELSMDIILELYDHRMAYLFGEALIKTGYTDDEFAVRGRRVYVRFTKPHTAQPLSRTFLTERIMQNNNSSFCEAYKYLTNEYTDTLDKLEIVRNESPHMYRQILNMGKPAQVFESYNKIARFIKKEEEN